MNRRRFAVLFFVIGFFCRAQEPVAPTPETVGPRRGDNWSDYNVVNSFETGYRLLGLSGSQDKYRSDVNYGSGVRLLNSFLSVNSKDGHGPLFDQLLLTTSGLGGDPYEAVRARVTKNRLYDYSLYWHENDYFNPGLVTDGGQGQHPLDTTYLLQDHDLTLLPQSPIRLFLGYSRNNQSGPGLSTVQLFSANGQFDPSGNIFPAFTNLKISQNEYRVGGEGHWRGLTLNVLRGWQDFKDDSPYQLAAPSTGDTPNGSTVLNSFLRSSPYHGTSPYWRVALFGNSRRINWNARFTYTSGRRAFITNETAIGRNQFGALANQQIITAGNAQRPVATGNVNTTTAITSKLTVASRTSVYNVRTQGNSAYLQYDNATQSSDLLYFQYLGIRMVETDLDALYQVRRWLDVHAGYEFSDRRIASTPQFGIAGVTNTTPFFQTNQLHSGIFGFRIAPLKGLTASFDGELGRATRAFTPKSDKNYNTFSGSIRYKLRHLQLMALTRTDYNLNSVSLSSYTSHSRTYSGSASWTIGSWFGIDGTYSKLHLDTLGGIAFFAGADFLPGQISSYISNIHSGTVSLRLSHWRTDFYVGYSHVQDVGDGRSAPTITNIGPPIAGFQTAQTFPLTFRSPSARISVRLTDRIRWNVGYQYYGYGESFARGENYLAHTGYTSLLWSF